MRLALLLTLALAACQNTPTEVASDPAPGAEASAAPTAAEIEAAANMPTTPVDAPMPASPTVLARGSFTGAGLHDVEGTAALYRLADGGLLIRLEGLVSDNGPDLEVWLVRRTADDVGEGAVSLGPLASTRGDQNYDVPEGTDASAFAGVAVWCVRFGVNFGVAPLAAAEGGDS